MSTRKCNRCEEVKELTEFFRDRHAKGGYGYACKVCLLKRKKEISEDVRERKSVVLFNKQLWWWYELTKGKR